jgi:hypothetical protein
MLSTRKQATRRRRRYCQPTAGAIVGDEIVSQIAVWRFGVVPAIAWALAACATSERLSPRWTEPAGIEQLQEAIRTATDCRVAAASNPRYSILVGHMPLDDVGKATLPEMIDPYLATSDEVTALDAWTRDVGACRDQLLQTAYANLPSFGPIIERARDKDDSVYVMLAHRKLTWGQAVMRLRADRTELRAGVITRAEEMIARVGAAQEEERNRRATILSSVIRIIP